jgi:cytoskeletal protein RodZ
MDLSIGAQLKQIRESQGIALETIAHKTHIALDYLQAIEADDVDALPSKVHLRGFLRLYASELGVTLDELTVGGYHLSEEILNSTDADNTELVQDNQSTPIDEPGETQVDKTPSETDTQPEPEPATIPSAETAAPPSLILDPESTSLPSESKESALIFQAIGEKIQQRRKLLSLSISEIHDNLHIPPQHLASIEAGQFDQLPSPVQAKGMLINYAEFLNLDTDALLSKYTDALQLQRIEKQDVVSQRGKRSARELSPTALRLKNFFTVDLLVITVLFLAFATFVIWGVNRILASDTPEIVESNIPGVSDILLATDTPTPELTSEMETTTEAEDVITETGVIEEEPLFTPVANTDPINILLVPRQQLWVQVTVDGDLAFQGRLLPGNAYDYSGQEQIDILTGNIGALQILFNNQDIGSQGLFGQVADLSFTASGLVLPPPTSTPTITETPQATPSPTESDDQTD